MNARSGLCRAVNGGQFISERRRWLMKWLQSVRVAPVRFRPADNPLTAKLLPPCHYGDTGCYTSANHCRWDLKKSDLNPEDFSSPDPFTIGSSPSSLPPGWSTAGLRCNTGSTAAEQNDGGGEEGRKGGREGGGKVGGRRTEKADKKKENQCQREWKERGNEMKG
ncbi:unnamed protein product [Pleuronectes platessa]|uniref:Uncharacterized protein n=1 Tax=Pleuronectes platessa TaxID=8262 RepID=A0A9N7VK67_PLEPL|nr:unnamed protein product [Pleuronectes platessa]